MRILKQLVKLTTRRPVITILVVLAITGFAFIPASNFNINTNIEEMFESDDPDVVAMDEVKDKFGEQELVTVVVDCSDSKEPFAELYIERLVEKLKEDGRFKNIQYKQDLSFIGEKKILYLPEDQIAILTNPDITLEMVEGYHTSIESEMDITRYIVSDNGMVYLVNMGVNIEMADAQERETLFNDLGSFLEETKSESKDYKNLKVGFTGGLMVIDYEGDKMAYKDFFITGAITLIFILALLFFSFRSLSIPLLAVIPILISIVWTTGVVFLIYDSLNLLSICFAILILGIGIDFSIHLLTRFIQEMEEHSDTIVAFQHTFVHTGKAVVLGCLTTMVAFISLCFADIKILNQLGIVGAVGLLITLIVVFVLLPAIVTLRLKFGKFKGRKAGFSILRIAGSKIQKFSLIIIILMIILSAVFAIGARNAELHENIYDMFPTEIETYRQLEKVKENFDYNPDIFVDVAKTESELTYFVKEFQGVGEILKVESVLDYLPQNQDEKLNIIKEAIEVHPEFEAVTWINVEPMAWDDLPLNIRQYWVSDKGEFLVKITPKGDSYEKSYQEKLLSDLRKIDPGVTADAVVFAKLGRLITDDVVHVSLWAILVIFVIVYIGFRRLNPIYAILSLVPVSFGILGLLGTYKFFGAYLNFFTIGLIPLVIGIGIDDGIHVMHRYREEGRGSIPKVIQLTGKAIFLTTATTCLAFSSLLFSAHPTMKSLASIPIIGLIICFFGAIVFLPTLLRVIVDRRELKKEKEKN